MFTSSQNHVDVSLASFGCVETVCFEVDIFCQFLLSLVMAGGMEEKKIPVYIGFSESLIKNSEKIDWTVNKIGGVPVFSPLISDDCLTKLVDHDLLCSKCQDPCLFLGQIISPVDDKPVDRVLYFFSCQRNKCDYFVVVRCVSQSANKSDDQNSPREKMDNDDDRDDDEEVYWSDGDESEDDQINESDNVSSLGPPKQLPTQKLKQIAIFKPFYIGIDDEEDLEKERKSSRQTSELSKEMPLIEPGGDEQYENVELQTVFKGDRASYKFHKKLRDHPDQMIRYSWQGQPCLNRSDCELNPTACEHCGSIRNFECQLMPGLIPGLKPFSSSDKTSNLLDFETVLIYSCSNNCIDSQVNLEQYFILKEPEDDMLEEFLSRK
ncbi:programmed cell death protein 2-like [Brevipalpus obovatus]|uniref:programmed cell death protein 2-like n=1 Tax=Brevipalpus obovatus TaxID=246614 RepID=UPI003D9F20DD